MSNDFCEKCGSALIQIGNTDACPVCDKPKNVPQEDTPMWGEGMQVNNLPPCPFCGEDFEIIHNHDGGYSYKHGGKNNCPMERNELTGWLWMSYQGVVRALSMRAK